MFVEDFGELMVGVLFGDKKMMKVKILFESENELMVGNEVEIEFEVFDVKCVDKVNFSDDMFS